MICGYRIWYNEPLYIEGERKVQRRCAVEQSSDEEHEQARRPP